MAHVLKKNTEAPLSAAEKQRLQKEARLQRQVQSFVDDVSHDASFQELNSDMARYLIMYEKRKRYLQIEGTLSTLLCILLVMSTGTESSVNSAAFLFPVIAVLAHMLYSVEQLRSYDPLVFTGNLIEERNAIIAALDKLNLYILGCPASHFRYLEKDFSDHDLILFVHQTANKKLREQEEALLKMYEAGRITGLTNEDGELIFDVIRDQSSTHASGQSTQHGR